MSLQASSWSNCYRMEWRHARSMDVHEGDIQWWGCQHCKLVDSWLSNVHCKFHYNYHIYPQPSSNGSYVPYLRPQACNTFPAFQCQHMYATLGMVTCTSFKLASCNSDFSVWSNNIDQMVCFSRLMFFILPLLSLSGGTITQFNFSWSLYWSMPSIILLYMDSTHHTI